MALSFLSDRTAPQQRALDEAIVRLWHRQRPDHPLDLHTVDHQHLKDNVAEHLTGSPPPDVVTWVAGNRMRSLAERGLMLDISSRRAALVAGYGARSRDLMASTPSYLLPTSHYWWAVYYRPSVFRALTIPAPIRTWPDLLAAADRFRGAGISPFAMGTRHLCPAAAWFDYLNMRLNGPGFHRGLMALRESYLDERVLAVFEFWRTLLDQDFFLGDPCSYDEDEAVTAVLHGRAGMVLVGSYVTEECENPDDLDFFRFPLIDPGLPVGEDSPVDGFFVNGRCADPDRALDLLAFLASRPVQQLALDECGILPARVDLRYDRVPAHVRKGIDLIAGADHLGQFYDLDTPWALADEGMRTFTAFLREPDRIQPLLERLDRLRLQYVEADDSERCGGFDG